MGSLTAPPGPAAASDEAILLIGHGTRDQAGADELRAFAADLAARLGDQRAVVPCFLELAEPPILEAIRQCVEQGVRRLVVMPLLLFGAGHVKNDIPTALAAARARYPGLELCYGAPLGVEPELLTIADQRLAELERELPPRPGAETAVLLVERGSSDPDANGQVFHLARLLWEGRGYGWVETCFIGITRPNLEEGLERCARLGARRVLVLPYFLFTGVLARRVEQIVEDRRRAYPDLELAVAPHLGRHPALTELTRRRLAEVERGEVRMSCDCCRYRVPLVGFETQVGRPPSSDHAHGLRTSDHGHAAHTHPHTATHGHHH